ncbi:MAG: D-glycerate dehydrogenase [Patescibacteria group bacterium]
MKIFITRPIPDNGINMLKAKGYEVVVNTAAVDRAATEEEMITGVKGADALLPLLTDKITAAVMDAGLPTLKIVANYAVGFNHVDMEAAKARNIIVTNTPGTNEEAVAEYTIAVMLNIARRLSEGDRATRAGKFTTWGMWDMLGESLIGKTLGIVGMGKIGSRVAEIAEHGFGMRVIPIGPEQKLDEILPDCDFVSLHVPLLDSTRHLMNETRLKLMKPSAYLINSSRGPVVDEAALVDALKAGTIKGAALDVYENEPNIHPELLTMENVLLTPHIAGGTRQAREKMAEVAATNIIECLEGRTPPNVVQ